MAGRSGQLASETTNWVALGLTFIFIGIQILMAGLQMITPGAADFGNPFAGGTDESNPEIIRQQAGERTQALFGHRLLLHDNDDAGVRDPIRYNLYCETTSGPPDDCDFGTFEDGDFNDTVWEVFNVGVFRTQVGYEGEQLESNRRVQNDVLNTTYGIGSYSYRVAMRGGETGSLFYDAEGPNVGGIGWTE